MAGNSPEEIAKVKKSFIVVGCILAVFTCLTVAVAVIPALDFGAHGFSAADMYLGLAIASFKATCVAAIFMHLKGEKPIIKWSFYGSLFCATTMILLIALADFNPIIFKGVLPYGSDMPETQVDQAYDLHTEETEDTEKH